METKQEELGIRDMILQSRSQSSFKFRWGKTGDEATIYFDTEDELEQKLGWIEKAIIEAGKLKTE